MSIAEHGNGRQPALTAKTRGAGLLYSCGAALAACAIALASGRVFEEASDRAPLATGELIVNETTSAAPISPVEIPPTPALEPADALWPSNLLTDEFVANRLNLSVELVQRLHKERSLDNQQLTHVTEKQLQRALWRLEHPKSDQPGEAIKWRLLRHKDERGNIRPDGLINAIRQREAMAAAAPAGEVAGMPAGRTRVLGGSTVPLVAGLNPAGWEWLGPGNIGGRTRALLIDRNTPTTFYAGAVGGGVWRSTNSGTSWQPLTGFSANLAANCIVADPLNPNTIYVGTGEGFFNADALRGAGIFVTTNGGTTWTQLPSTNNSNFNFVNRLAISANGMTILAATGSGLFRSTNGGLAWTTPTGGVGVRMLDCDFHPTDSNRCICSTSGARLWSSTDAGATFTAAQGLGSNTDGFFERTESCYARQTPANIYCSIDRAGGTIFRSTDNGLNFTQRGTGSNYLSSQGWYDNIIWAGDPTNADRVLVGGIDIWRSTDGGATLTKISDWTRAPLSAHADNHEIITPPAYNGTTNQELLVANDGGVYRAGSVFDTVATNVTWQELNNNYGVTQFYGGDGNATSGVYVGGTQDNGTNRFTPGANATENWLMYIGGDGGFSAADQTSPNFFYGEFQWLGLHRSSNGGASASFIAGGLPEAQPGQTNFISPFVLDPNVPTRLLAGAQRLWRSVDSRAASVVWNPIKASTGSFISAIAVNPRNSDQIWVGHNNGDVFSTNDGTATNPTWVKRDGTFLPNRYCERLAVDPRNGNTIYASFGGFSTGNIWKSTDAGSTWTDVSGNLPAAPINGIAVHPTRANWLYVGTEVGVFGSETGGTTWSPTNEGPLNVAVDEVKFVGNFLLAVTHGRGMYRINPNASTGGGGGSGGIVTVAYNAGTRTLTLNELVSGTAVKNTLSVSRRGNTLTVQSGAGTQLRDGTNTTTTFSRNVGSAAMNITSNLNGGDDSISLSGLNLNLCQINLGPGADQATLSFCKVTTSQIDGGIDANTDRVIRSATTITNNQDVRIP